MKKQIYLATVVSASIFLAASAWRGEIARRAANLVCHKLAPEKTVRICLGGAITKDTGQRNLVRNAQRVGMADIEVVIELRA